MLQIIPFSGGRPRFLGTEGAATSAAAAAAAAAPGPGPGPAAHAASGASTTATTRHRLRRGPRRRLPARATVPRRCRHRRGPRRWSPARAAAPRHSPAPAAGDDRASAPPGRRRLTAHPLRLSLTSVGPVPASTRLVAALMSLTRSVRP
jgi:hypothetical protein